MNSFLFRSLMAVLSFGPSYLNSGQNAHADDWGCQVILCLSNPGGPMQYAECRPPVQKLWRWLARGKSFPTCRGVGFQSSRPHYDPLYCDDGFRLTVTYSDKAREAACISASRQIVNKSLCRHDRDWPRNSNEQITAAQ